MVLPSFNQAYFENAGMSASVSKITFELPNEFTFEFPAKSADFAGIHVNSYVNWFNGTSGKLSDVGSVDSCVYRFTIQQGYYYRDSPYMSGDFLIYRVDLTEFGGETLSDDEIAALGYIYVYSLPSGARSVTGDRYERYTFYFLPSSELPEGLQYDFSNEIITPSFSDGPMNWLYDFGVSVFNFFPRVEDMMNTEIMGSSFVWLLTQGFLVYCGWVVIKFAIGIIT